MLGLMLVVYTNLIGDFGDPSNKEEVGGGDNANTHAGSPDSPSSSGGFRQNFYTD